MKVGIVVAVLVISQAVSAFALDPPDRKQVTDGDKLYFVSRLDLDQISQLVKIIKHKVLVGNTDCEKASSIENALVVISETTPIFKEASEAAGISPYARNYSKELVAELSGVEKPLRELLAYYGQGCTSAVDQQTQTEKKETPD